ncbi:response regulator [uncultured Gimesia sp.]|jgi:FixJ family two-component response regulator|uniref:response regulator transcription factor n=1 Tax=uncultured Gimesia sp. TaxID=1678688 RepID=UPI00261AD64A|nr:response regulator [uncultured Gimesia sp.]
MNRLQKLPEYYKPSVYIVEDNESVRDSYVTLIKSCGLHVEAFASAEDFLRSTGINSCGCVLTDYQMNGYNGLELLKNMKSAGYRLPAILVSGSLDSETTCCARSEGAFAILEKPYSVPTLWETVITAILNDSQNRTRT